MKKVDFDRGGLTQNILQTAFPLLVAQILNLLYSIVDRVYIGRIPGAGTAALGAVGLCFPVIMIVAAFTNMYGMGGAPLFAIALGQKNRRRADDLQNTALRLLLLTAVIITVVGEVMGGRLLTLFGATEAELPTSLSYLRFYLIGTLPLMISAGMSPFINAQGFSAVSMIAVVTGAAANLLLDPLFIFTLGLGVEGAAIATVISQILAMAVTLRFLLGKQNEFPIRLAFRFPYAGEIMSLGLSPFIMQATNSLVQISCNTVLMHFGGSTYVSIMTIVSSVRSILDTPVMALTEGTSPVISYNYGAKRVQNVKKAIRLMVLMCFSYTAAMWLLLFFHPQMFVRIFSSDRELVTECSRALHLYFFAFIFQTLQYSGQTVFKALNKKRRTIFFSLLRKAVLVVPLTFALPYLFGMGTDGVFIAEPVSNVIGGTACFVTMRLTIWRELDRMEASSEDAFP